MLNESCQEQGIPLSRGFTDMIKKPLLSVDFYEFQCPKDIYEPVKDHLKNSTEFRKNENNLISYQLQNDAMEAWINDCLSKVQQDKFTGSSFELKVTTIWANKANKLQFHHKHFHPNSIVSGILYLNVNEGYGKTNFFMKDPWWSIHNEGFLKLLDGNTNDASVEILAQAEPEEGKMIVFPSTIWHSVQPHKNMSARYTVSFNSFFRGTNPRHTLQLTL